LAALLDFLGIVSTDALGYSQGGPVVQELVLDYPAKVRRLFKQQMLQGLRANGGDVCSEPSQLSVDSKSKAAGPH